jgi:hypothetical protein
MLTHMSSPVTVEPLHTDQKLLCWKSVLAGVLISIMAYMILTALGAGIGGLTASSLISNDEGGGGLATGAGLWLGISSVISLFLGTYFALRVSKYVTNKVGAAHGFLIASIFFILLIWGIGRTIGGISRGILRFDFGFSQSQLHSDTDAQAKENAEKAADGIAEAGWSLFVTFSVGLLAAVIGGRVGAKANYDRPFITKVKTV